MSSTKIVRIFILVVLLLTACTGEKPRESPGVIEDDSIDLPLSSTTPSPDQDQTPTPDWNDHSSYRAQLKITTSSDWTGIRLIQGLWHSISIISASDQAQVGELSENLIQLTQSIDRAEAGKQVELIVEVSFADLEPGDTLVFEIDRGNYGSTQVEIFKIIENNPEYITVFRWEDIQRTSPNAESYEVAADAFLDPVPNEYIVIAQLNFWYYGPGIHGGFENGDGSRDTPFIPRLGYTYNAGDPAVVYQQIEWAVDYGVDAFSIEWTTPRGIGCCGSMEDTLDDVFLKSPNIHKVRWAIFYDFILRLMQTEEIQGEYSFPVNFDQPVVYETFVDDFVHFAEKYFAHPQYLMVDERPVIYIWATNSFTGNFAGAMKEAREQVAELGYDVFIVGDEVCLGCFNSGHASQFDGSSTFTFLIPGIDNHHAKDIEEAAEAVDWAFTWWRNQLSGLKVAGREELVNFQPAWAPQYNESWVNTRDNPIKVPAESKDQVRQMAEVARKHAEPVGDHDLKLIWLNTWNCWGESTTVEPTADEGPKYPAGNYGFDMLEVVEEVFGSATYYSSPLR